MTETRRCHQCGAELPGDAPDGVCPRCVLGLGLRGELFGGAPSVSCAIGGESSGAANVGPRPAGSTGSALFPRSDRFVPPVPEELSGYFPELEIQELLGQGGMGAVYKARQRRLDRLVALKILPPDVAKFPGFAERFTREAKTLARLNHPQIVTLYDFGETGGLYYFLMEYLSGMNLRRLLVEGRLEARQALAIVPQICEALQYAHEAGVVHRDIKPENILLDQKGRVKIADFGLAKLMSRDDTAAGRAAFTLTGSQQVMGTPHYMAPEQMERPLGVDHRADIYSLGVVFYEMLTGELPLGRFAPPSRRVAVDVRLDEVVLRTLEKEPERRYQHANDVKSDVETISRVKPERLWAEGLPDSGINELRPDEVHKQVIRRAGTLWLTAASGLIVSSWAAGIVLRLKYTGDEGLDGAIMLAAGVLPIAMTIAIGAVAMAKLKRYALCRAAAILATLPCHVAWLIGIPAGYLALLFLNRPEVRAAFAKHERERSGTFARDALLVILASLMFTLLIASAWPTVWRIRGEQSIRVETPAPPRTVLTPEVPPGRANSAAMSDFEPPPNWVLGPQGPRLTDWFAQAMGLGPRQVDKVNKVLKTIYEESLLIEARNTKRKTDDLGHMLIKITAYPGAVAKLEDRLWSQLDAILEPRQQSIARLNLNLDRHREPPVALRDLVGPDFFGWGKDGARIELWRVGTWYHWKVEARGHSDESSAPELPIEYRRFWEGSPK